MLRIFVIMTLIVSSCNLDKSKSTTACDNDEFVQPDTLELDSITTTKATAAATAFAEYKNDNESCVPKKEPQDVTEEKRALCFAVCRMGADDKVSKVETIETKSAKAFTIDLASAKKAILIRYNYYTPTKMGKWREGLVLVEDNAVVAEIAKALDFDLKVDQIPEDCLPEESKEEPYTCK